MPSPLNATGLYQALLRSSNRLCPQEREEYLYLCSRRLSQQPGEDVVAFNGLLDSLVMLAQWERVVFPKGHVWCVLMASRDIF